MWPKKNTVRKEQVAKLVDDTYRYVLIYVICLLHDFIKGLEYSLPFPFVLVNFLVTDLSLVMISCGAAVLYVSQSM